VDVVGAVDAADERCVDEEHDDINTSAHTAETTTWRCP
jgi:hypothetical protein